MTETNAESQVEGAPANEVAETVQETRKQAVTPTASAVAIVAIAVTGCVILAAIAACTWITIAFIQNAPW